MRQLQPPDPVVARRSSLALHHEPIAGLQAVTCCVPCGVVAAAALCVTVADRHCVVAGPFAGAAKPCIAAARPVGRAAGSGDAFQNVNDATFSGLVASGPAGMARVNIDCAQRVIGMAHPSHDAPLRQIENGRRSRDTIGGRCLAPGFRRDIRVCAPLWRARSARSSLRRTVSAAASASDGAHATRAGARSIDMVAGKANGGGKSPLHSTRTCPERRSRSRCVPAA